MSGSEFHEVSAEKDEILPFAVDGCLERQQPGNYYHIENKHRYPQQSELQSTVSLLSVPSGSCPPPDLVSSILSYPTDESTQESSTICGLAANGSSFYQEPSNFSSFPVQSSYEPSHHDTTALPILDQLLEPREVQEEPRSVSGTYRPPPSLVDNSISSSMGFSQLMHDADNANDYLVLSHSPHLPCHYEGLEAPRSSTNESYYSAVQDSMGELSDSTIIIGHSTHELASRHQISKWLPFLSCVRPSKRTSFAPRRRHYPVVERKLLDPSSFEVSMTLDSCNFQDVMNIIGNPELLRLWFEPIYNRKIVITKCSEGALNRSSNQVRYNETRADYEGEWIEATVTDLVSPPSVSTLVCNTKKGLWESIGFPSYAKLNIFAERQKGRVSLNIGPFPGDVTISHTITVNDQMYHDEKRISINDTVRLSHDKGNVELLWGIFDCVENCFLPTIVGYMEQAVSSLKKLSVLVDNGGRFDQSGPQYSWQNDERSSFRFGSPDMSDPLLS